MEFSRLFLKAFFCALLTSITLQAAVQKRVLLSPWSSLQHRELYQNPTLRHIESALNHLGIYIDYFDIDKEALPSPKTKKFKSRYLGLISCFQDEELPNSKKWIKFLYQYSQTNLPWVALCRFGFLENTSTGDKTKLFNQFQVQYIDEDNFDASPIRRTTYYRKKGMNFERPLDLSKSLPPISKQKKRGSAVKHWIQIKLASSPLNPTMVFTSPKMSLAYGDYGLHVNLEIDRMQWQIDPFQFFKESLSIDRSDPVPDVTLLNGRRVFFSHIDGDAFHSISHIDTNRYCGEVMETEILRKYGDLPFGVSIVVAEVNKAEHGNERLMQTARRILKLPNVEAASHTFFHPLVWKKGELAYNKLGRKLDLTKEVIGSLNFIQRELSPKKKINTFYWSGDCNPPSEALSMLKSRNVLNINGGDGRFDSEYPSIAYLSPLGRPVGRHFQVYSVNANDNIYTNGWKGPYFGFRNVIETFKRSSKPILLKPINPYFHFFSAEREVGIQAIRETLEWSLKKNISPVFPSSYIRSVLGFRRALIERLSPYHYRIRNQKGLNTLRIDNAQGKFPDIKKSRGIIGFRHLSGSLYIHIQNLESNWIDLHLTKNPPQSPYLEAIGGIISRPRLGPNSGDLSIAPFTRGPIVLSGLKKGVLISTISKKQTRHPIEGGRVQIPLEPSTYSRNWSYQIETQANNR